MEKLLTLCMELAVKAGQEILSVYNRDFKVYYKEDSSPLTDADRFANELIVSGLKDKYPDYAILAEESGDDKSRLENDWCFIVDPLDGTKEFVKRNGQFTVNIALAHKGRVVLGVIFVPVTRELYYAAKGKGAYYVRVDSGELTVDSCINDASRIKVSDRVDGLTMVGSRSHMSDRLKVLIEENKDRIKEVLSAGSSIKGCMVAKGEADIYYRFGPTMEWDTAAMQCIAEEAGGIFRQTDGSVMTYNRENSLNEKGFYIINRKDNLFL